MSCNDPLISDIDISTMDLLPSCTIANQSDPPLHVQQQLFCHLFGSPRGLPWSTQKQHSRTYIKVTRISSTDDMCTLFHMYPYDVHVLKILKL